MKHSQRFSQDDICNKLRKTYCDIIYHNDDCPVQIWGSVFHQNQISVAKKYQFFLIQWFLIQCLFVEYTNDNIVITRK